MLNKILNKIRYWYISRSALPYWSIICVDFLIIIIAAMVSTYICEGPRELINHFWDRVFTWCCLLVFFFIGMRIFHTYSGIVRYMRTTDMLRVFNAQVVAFALIFIVRLFFSKDYIIASTGLKNYTTTFCLCIAGQWSIRVLMKAIYESTFNKGVKRAFIFGVQKGAEAIASTIQSSPSKQYSIVGFVSPNGDLADKYMFGAKVRRIGPNLIEHMKKAHASVMIVSPLQAENFRNNTKLVEELIKNKIHILMLSEAELWTPERGMKQEQLHEVDIEDLLPRDKIEVDLDAISELLKGKRILITGAAGSIGSEMVNQVAKANPSEMVLIDQAETPMHNVRLKMARKFPNIKAWTIVGSISNPTHMEEIFSEHKPEYVFHAAAYKHVPMMEDNPAMAIQNNIYGTRVIADLAVKYGTKKFVMISTDKAVNPTNVMGCSKRICEIYCQSLNKALQELKLS